MSFEQLVNRIRMLRAYMPLSQIHDAVVGADVSEEDFFLAYVGAVVLDKDQEGCHG